MFAEKPVFPNIMLIAGTGRNVGKTELVCQLISHFSKTQAIIGLKVTNHFHDDEAGTFALRVESNNVSQKDTSRMLRAGASKVYYCQSDKENLQKAFNKFLQQINPDSMVICESGALFDLIQPGIFIMVKNSKLPVLKPGADKFLEMADLIVTSDGEAFDICPEQLNWPAITSRF
jgi:hypothetical protein